MTDNGDDSLAWDKGHEYGLEEAWQAIQLLLPNHPELVIAANEIERLLKEALANR